MIRKYIFLLIFSVLFVPSVAFSATKDSKKVPTNITSSTMNYDANTQTVTFEGNVIVKRPDFTINSKKLIVYLEKKSPKKSQENDGELSGMEAGNIDKIVALKDVVIISGDKKATCQKATYFANDDKFVLENNPILTEKDNKIVGKVITYYVKENKSHVDGVSATFFAPDKKLSPTGK